VTYRRIAWLRLSALIVALLVLGGTGLIGVYDAFDEWRGAHSLMQKSVTAGGGVYGVLGLIAVMGLILRRKWSARWAIAWAIVTTYVGSAAVTVYGEAQNVVSATAGAFAMCVVVTGLVVWLAAVGSRKIVSYDEVQV
jgi:hypothetical protein